MQNPHYSDFKLGSIAILLVLHLTVVNIILDKEYQPANKVDSTTHELPILSGDVRKMYSSRTLSNNNPQSLLAKGFFYLALHFGRRGREGWKNIKRSSSVFKQDDQNSQVEYVTLNYNEATKKNHGIQLNLKEKDQRMYSVPNDDLCPVKSLQLYLQKLSDTEEQFLQNPRIKENLAVDKNCFVFFWKIESAQQR